MNIILYNIMGKYVKEILQWFMDAEVCAQVPQTLLSKTISAALTYYYS